MDYRYVVWDWNGTLLDDAWLARETINELLVRRGRLAASTVRYQEVFGFPLRDFCRRVGFDLECESFEALSDQYSSRYEERRLECRLRTGVPQILAAIRRAGAVQSVLSAYLQHNLEDLVGHFQLAGYFTRVAGLDNPYGEGKVERGRRWLAEEGWPADQVLMVGDTLYDGEVARAMGVDCVLLASGYQSRERLEQSGIRVVDDLPGVMRSLGMAWEDGEVCG
jgi:phosphoglycolate phosphatase